MYVSNFNENLPNCKEVFIKIDKKTRKTKKIDGIKITPFEHEYVLAQQIIEHIESGQENLYNGNVLNMNTWIKSDIGTGKSLISFMILEYFKNSGYKTLPLTVPYKSDILTGVKKNDIQPFKVDQFEKGYYEYVYNEDYVLHEILKTTGFEYTDSKYAKEIKFESCKHESIIFVENEVMKQFQKYLQTQTSLSFYVIDNNTDFIKYMINYDNINEDIILWNTNNINVQQSLTNMQQNLKHLFLNLSAQEIIDKMEYIKQFYSIDKQYSFNKFWIEHINNRQKKPFAFVCFDDFDTMELENFEWIPSLVNMYIGTTMIQKNQQSINQCSSFIFNKLVNKYSAFRIVPEQIKEILKFPKVNITNILCKTPSNVYAEYKLLLYVYSLYSKYMEMSKKPMTQIEALAKTDYSDLMSGKVSIDNLFKKYILQFEINKIHSFNVYVDLTIEMELIFKINLCDKKISAGGDPKFYEQKIEQYKQEMFNDYDNSFIEALIEMEQKNSNFLTEFQKVCPTFTFENSNLDNSEIYDFIDNQPITSEKVCMTTCCCTMFNKENIEKSVNVSGLDYYCSFCKEQISNIKKFAWHNSSYIEETNFSTSPIFTNQKIQKGQTKIEQILRLIKDNLKYTDGEKHSYVDINDQIIEKENKITILYSEDYLDIEQEYMKSDFDIDNLVEDIKANKPIYIYPYEYDENYEEFRKDEIFELQSIFKTLSYKYPEKFEMLSQAYSILEKQIKEIPDVIEIRSIEQITGENMVYADNFIFATIPQDYNEFLEIVGRSNRIERTEENDVFMLYYPHEDILNSK